MGKLALPNSGLLYLDTSPVIYSVEKIKPYAELMDPVWSGASEEVFELVSSELLLLETLVKPVQVGDSQLESIYRQLLTQSQEVQLTPIDSSALEKAIQLRATSNLKTPDAIHAATALQHSCDLIITNDPIFKRISGLNVLVLSDFI